MTPAIELLDLTVRFGSRTVLESLRGCFAGRALGLLGPNGAGKSTLINTLLGFHRPSSGATRIFGIDPERDPTQVRQWLGYMPENDAFVAQMTGVHFVRYMAELAGLPAKDALERAHEVLFYVGLGEARYRKLGSYSIGMKQLVKLAQAIAHAPRLLLLDEPTNGLDPSARQRMIRLIQEIRDAGHTKLVLSSHLLRDVEQCCDEVLILKGGRIRAQVDLEQQRAAHRRFLDLEVSSANEGFARGLTELGCDCATFSGVGELTRMRLVLGDGIEIRSLYRVAQQNDVVIRKLSQRRDSLEEIFLEAVRDDSGEGPRGPIHGLGRERAMSERLGCDGDL